MISVDHLVDRARRTLGLHKDPKFELSDAYHGLWEIMLDLELDVPSQVSTTTVTTIASQSEYSLPETVARITSIEWPEEWTGPVSALTRDALQAIRQGTYINDVSSSSQPSYYAFWQEADGTHRLALERAEYISAGLTISIDYQVIGGTEPTTGANIQLPVSQEPILRYGLLWKLAETYDPNRSADFNLTYERLKRDWIARQSLPTNQSISRPVHPF